MIANIGKIVALLIVVSCTVSFAGKVYDCQIEELSLGGLFGNWIAIRTTGGTVEEALLTKSSSHWHFVLEIKPNDELNKRLFATLLAAQMNKTTVSLDGTGTVYNLPANGVDYEKLDRLRIK